MRRARSSGLVLLGMAAGGTLLGHLLAYLAAVPGEHARAEVLRHAGHGYLPTAAATATLAVLAAVSATAATGFRRGRGLVEARPGRLRVALQLWAMQSAGFLAMEVIERAAAGSGFSTLSVRLFLFGVLAQGLVSVAAAIVLAVIGRAGEAAAWALSPVRGPRRTMHVRLGGQCGAPRPSLRYVCPSRAPPLATLP